MHWSHSKPLITCSEVDKVTVLPKASSYEDISLRPSFHLSVVGLGVLECSRSPCSVGGKDRSSKPKLSTLGWLQSQS